MASFSIFSALTEKENTIKQIPINICRILGITYVLEDND